MIYNKKEVKKIASEINNRFNDYFEIIVGKSALEISTNGSNKKDALITLLSELNIDPDSIVVIGDGENDVGMLSHFKNSYAMNNGCNNAKRNAKFIIDKFEEIEKYLYS